MGFGQRISAEQLDTAAAAGALRLGKTNTRPARCAVAGEVVLPGTGQQVYIDGVRRGYACNQCAHNIRVVITRPIILSERPL